jgi:hypothetical protein
MRHSFLTGWAAFLAALIILIPARSESTAQTTSKYKNIKVLSGLSDNEISREMQAWTKALGERCTFCHEADPNQPVTAESK